MSATIVRDPTRAPFTKSIEPVWEQDGKRRRICGFHAFLNGNVLTIPGSTYPALFNDHGDAERALDEAALLFIEEEAALPFEPTPADVAEITREYVADVPSIGGAPVELVQEVAAELAKTCHLSGDKAGRNAYNKCAFNAAKGITLVDTPDGWLVPSSQGGGVVYRVERHGSVYMCQCEAAANAKDCGRGEARRVNMAILYLSTHY